ncbi:hypothetical protein Ctob_016402 [Chrysochromulina tobinii]|uniref:Uncharacterized protein n=1 Tax=Chrysochromulina tobinii TaxID=1460289 RepID=A0A0M0LQZ6_9EUKA|nr:hypothetical protein Ctob_016402 [Chrysochromulina tobinii]|eukprot:KOO53332.1 hypothetical protein Ctob_016402 [Chrysochromulina sp. CCMP291]
MYARSDLQNFPSPRWENALLTCPFRFSSFMMGRWCHSLGRHSVNCELPDLLQHSYSRAHSSSKGRWCHSLGRQSCHLVVHDQREHSFNWRRCLCPGWHSDHLIMHLQSR